MVSHFPSTQAAARARLVGPLPAQVLRVIDGDTLEVRVMIWLDQELTVKVRLRDLDTPEMHGQCAHERELAREARRHLSRLIKGRRIILYDITQAKYATRVLARVTTDDGDDLTIRMIRDRHGVPYNQRHKAHWCKPDSAPVRRS